MLPRTRPGRRGFILGALAAPSLLPARRAHGAEAEPVDVELVLAVDVSRSVDREEQEMQFRGYAAAFRDRRRPAAGTTCGARLRLTAAPAAGHLR